MITPEIKNTLNDPCTSFWLKDAITQLLNRDCLDAQYDAEHLAKLFSARAELIFAKH